METVNSKNYTNGEVTIVWKPSLCIHSKNCWRAGTGLPEVFDPRSKPWIRPDRAESGKIVEHVKKCPGGALSYFYNDRRGEEKVSITPATRVEVVPGGPLLVHGDISVNDHRGETKKSNTTAFCRCGMSGNKPYCDGSHVQHKFKEE